MALNMNMKEHYRKCKSKLCHSFPKTMKLNHVTKKQTSAKWGRTHRYNGKEGGEVMSRVKYIGMGCFCLQQNYPFQEVQVLCFFHEVTQMILNLFKHKIWSFSSIMQHLENIRQGCNISGYSSLILHCILLTF